METFLFRITVALVLHCQIWVSKRNKNFQESFSWILPTICWEAVEKLLRIHVCTFNKPFNNKLKYILPKHAFFCFVGNAISYQLKNCWEIVENISLDFWTWRGIKINEMLCISVLSTIFWEIIEKLLRINARRRKS